MKKSFTLLLIVLNSLQSFSQSIYKLDVEPVIGEDYVRHSIDNANALYPGLPGIGRTWDLSNATFSLQNDYYFSIVEPTTTPYLVPGASFVLKNVASWDTLSVGYEYFKDTTDGYYALHDYGSILEVNYSSYEFIWKFPLLYGDSITSSHSFSTTAFSVTYNYTATSKLIFDGVGTLMTGSGSISNVMRFKYEQIATRPPFHDTTYITGYFWYLAGIHHPLFDYTAILDPNGLTYYSAHSFSNANTTGVLGIISDNDIQVYQDPANDYVFVKSTSGIERIILHDINGRQILNESFLTQTNYSFNTEILSRGVYFLSVNSGNRFFVRKFVKL